MFEGLFHTIPIELVITIPKKLTLEGRTFIPILLYINNIVEEKLKD